MPCDPDDAELCPLFTAPHTLLVPSLGSVAVGSFPEAVWLYLRAAAPVCPTPGPELVLPGLVPENLRQTHGCCWFRPRRGAGPVSASSFVESLWSLSRPSCHCDSDISFLGKRVRFGGGTSLRMEQVSRFHTAVTLLFMVTCGPCGLSFPDGRWIFLVSFLGGEGAGQSPNLKPVSPVHLPSWNGPSASCHIHGRDTAAWAQGVAC